MKYSTILFGYSRWNRYLEDILAESNLFNILGYYSDYYQSKVQNNDLKQKKLFLYKSIEDALSTSPDLIIYASQNSTNTDRLLLSLSYNMPTVHYVEKPLLATNNEISQIKKYTNKIVIGYNRVSNQSHLQFLNDYKMSDYNCPRKIAIKYITNYIEIDKVINDFRFNQNECPLGAYTQLGSHCIRALIDIGLTDKHIKRIRYKNNKGFIEFLSVDFSIGNLLIECVFSYGNEEIYSMVYESPKESFGYYGTPYKWNYFRNGHLMHKESLKSSTLSSLTNSMKSDTKNKIELFDKAILCNRIHKNIENIVLKNSLTHINSKESN